MFFFLHYGYWKCRYPVTLVGPCKACRLNRVIGIGFGIGIGIDFNNRYSSFDSDVSGEYSDELFHSYTSKRNLESRQGSGQGPVNGAGVGVKDSETSVSSW